MKYVTLALVAPLLLGLALLPSAAAGHHAPPSCQVDYLVLDTPAGRFYIIHDGNLFDSCFFVDTEIWLECNGEDGWQHTSPNEDCRIV